MNGSSMSHHGMSAEDCSVVCMTRGRGPLKVGEGT